MSKSKSKTDVIGHLNRLVELERQAQALEDTAGKIVAEAWDLASDEADKVVETFPPSLNSVSSRGATVKRDRGQILVEAAVTYVFLDEDFKEEAPDLPPCPLCGYAAWEINRAPQNYQIACRRSNDDVVRNLQTSEPVCFVMTGSYRTAEEAREVWSRRERE